MPGVKGKTGTHTNRSNQWLAGTASRIRTDEVFSFKPKIEVIEAVKTDIEQRQVTKTEWLDMAVESMLGQGQGQENEDFSRDIPDCLKDAVLIAIAQKDAAIRAEKKKKKSLQDEAQIERWIAQIDELEKFL